MGELIAVVHLVWGPLGPEPLRTFLGSYRAHPAGAKHELVILLNGVSESQRSRLVPELREVEHRLLTTESPVQDLAAYVQAAQRLEHERLCFMNSYSQILVSDWLAKLSDALDRPRAGLVGATGSWASTRSWVMHAYLLPTPYRAVMPSRRVAREQFLAIELERAGELTQSLAAAPTRSLADSLRAKWRTLPDIPRQLLGFESFPAPHLRTNAFMLDRTVLERLQIGTIRSKMDAYALENGRHNLTRQAQRMGLRTLVVARDGAAFDEQQWPSSRTFWQGDQEGLLVADNQTRSYAEGGADRRRLLSAFAWGSHADPRLPALPPRGAGMFAE